MSLFLSFNFFPFLKAELFLKALVDALDHAHKFDTGPVLFSFICARVYCLKSKKNAGLIQTIVVNFLLFS